MVYNSIERSSADNILPSDHNSLLSYKAQALDHLLVEDNQYSIDELISILKSLDESYVDPRLPSTEPVDWWNSIYLSFLAIAGAICSICSGFDGSVSILNLFIGIPSWTVFLVGFALSLVLVVLFSFLEFSEISENLNVRLPQSSQLLDQYVMQAELVNLIVSKIRTNMQDINSMILNNTNTTKLKTGSLSLGVNIDEMVSTLKKMHGYRLFLKTARDEYEKKLDCFYVKAIKLFTTLLIGLLFFNGGFFTGQVLSVVVLSAFLSSGISATAWPVLLISILVGLAGLSLYWNHERHSVEKLTCRGIGLDENKINKLPTDNFIEQEKKCLDLLLIQTKFNCRSFFQNTSDSSPSPSSLECYLTGSY